MHIDNKEKDNLIPGEGLTPGLDDKEVQNFFFVDFNSIDTNNILDIHKHLI